MLDGNILFYGRSRSRFTIFYLHYHPFTSLFQSILPYPDVMMQAHTNGFAVVGEWGVKETAEDYCKQLLQKGLVSEVVEAQMKDDEE